MITISNLKKSFGEKVALDIPEFHINKGEIQSLKCAKSDGVK